MSNQKIVKIFFLALLGFILLEVGVLMGLYSGNSSSKSMVNDGAEVSQIKSSKDIQTQSKLYRDLIQRVGPEQAQEDLYSSGLPFTGETHLLNHVVGDYLYEQYGTKGLLYCKDYFLSSCYHGFILQAIGVGGMSELEKTFKECLEYRSNVYVQCSHAIGHGFLVKAGYKNLIEALKMCDEAEAKMKGFPAFNCYDGVFMENIWAVHEGTPSKDRWVKESDLFYPCTDSNIHSKYSKACWSNQSALAYLVLKGDIEKVANNLCHKVEDEENQKTCFRGLARQIHPLAKGSSKKTFDLCSLLKTSKWQNYCVAVNAGASYAVGDRGVSFELCEAAVKEGEEICYTEVIKSIQGYKKPSESLKALCSPIKELTWRNSCETPK